MGKKDKVDSTGDVPNWSPKIGWGDRLQAVRQARDMSGEKLGKGIQAKRADASRQTVSDWESERHYPNVWQLAEICRRLDTTADFLLFGREDAKAAISPQVVAAVQMLASLQPQDLVVLLALVAAGKITGRGPLPRSVSSPQAEGASNHTTG